MVTNFFYISDIHFGYQTDTNPIRRTQYNLTFSHYKLNGPKDYDNRLVKNWNGIVKDNDHVFILGDISCHDLKTTNGILKGLKGQKHLILGNHDYQFLHDNEFRNQFVEIKNYKEQNLGDGTKLILTHYPLFSWNGRYRGNIMFYGHVHNSWEYQAFIDSQKALYKSQNENYPINSLNVGSMMTWMNMTPRSYQFCIAEIGRQQQELYSS